METAAVPLQVSEAGKRSEDLMKLHSEGKGPDEVDEAPIKPQEPATDDFKAQLTDLQKKYDVLSGKYKKEIENADLKNLQRLENENVLLKREMGAMQSAMQENSNLVKEVQAELAKSKTEPAAEAPPIDVNSILSDEERAHLDSEDLGGETLNILLKLVRAAGGDQLAGQLKEISTKVDHFEKRVENTEKVQHQATIDTEVPEFKTVNNEPTFHTWLDKPVSTYSDRTNRQELQESLNSGNFQAVKEGILAFKAETGWSADPDKDPKKDPPPTIEPDESFVNDGPPESGKKIYTMDQVKKFYEDQTKGKYVGREKEAAAIDRDITLAQGEGRIKQ